MAHLVGSVNPFRCNDCGRSFGRGEHLRRHRRIHTKEKPYACYCGQSFSRRDLLTRHQRLYHTNTTPSAGLHTPQTSVTETPSSTFPPPNHGPGLEDVTHEISDFMTNAGFELGFDIDDFLLHDAVAHHNLQSVQPQDFRSPEAPIVADDPDSTADTTPRVDASPSKSMSRIPIMSRGDDDFKELKPITQPWKVTEQERVSFARSLEPHSAYISRFMLPSRLSIARYVAGFVDGFSQHHPFIHMPTFRVINYLERPELVLALLAIGAQFRYESSRALSLYRAGRSIILGRMQSGELSSLGHIGSDGPAIDTLGAMLLLSTFASWQGKAPALMRESLEYQALLARLARDCGLCEEHNCAGEDEEEDWLEWVTRETGRRTKFSVFSFLNLQSIAFGTPPLLLASEIDLRLPTSCRQWLARDQSSWLAARDEGPQPTYFGDMLSQLLRVEPILEDNEPNRPDPMPVTTPFGNFLLIHAMVQRLILSWNLSGTGDYAEFEVSLRKWREAWQKAPECLLDLTNPKDSLSWSATSLLGLAHVRVHFDMGGRRSELLRNNNESSEVVTEMARSARPPVRGPHLINALLHSVHALSVPAQLGVEYLASCQAFFLSLQHAFCFFEIAVFMSKWLLSLCEDRNLAGMLPITEMECKVVNWAVAVVAEVQISQGLATEENDDDSSGLPPILNGSAPATHPVKLRQLAVAIVSIFARILRDSNSVWPIVAVFGEGLEAYSRLLMDQT